eukprot:s1261_g29.t1
MRKAFGSQHSSRLLAENFQLHLLGKIDIPERQATISLLVFQNLWFPIFPPLGIIVQLDHPAGALQGILNSWFAWFQELTWFVSFMADGSERRQIATSHKVWSLQYQPQRLIDGPSIDVVMLLVASRPTVQSVAGFC